MFFFGGACSECRRTIVRVFRQILNLSPWCKEVQMFRIVLFLILVLGAGQAAAQQNFVTANDAVAARRAERKAIIQYRARNQTYYPTATEVGQPSRPVIPRGAGTTVVPNR